VIRNSFGLDYKAIQDSYIEASQLCLKQVEKDCVESNFIAKFTKTDWLSHV
jgi:hypothetical protein